MPWMFQASLAASCRDPDCGCNWWVAERAVIFSMAPRATVRLRPQIGRTAASFPEARPHPSIRRARLVVHRQRGGRLSRDLAFAQSNRCIPRFGQAFAVAFLHEWLAQQIDRRAGKCRDTETDAAFVRLVIRVVDAIVPARLR